MDKARVKVIILIILGIALFGIVYYELGQSEWLGGKDIIPTSWRERSKKDQNPIRYDVPALRLDLLSLASPDFDPSGRNLFNYEKPKPTPEELEAMRRAQEEARRRAEEERKRREEEQRRLAELAKRRAETMAHQPPPPPTINFKFIGYIGKPDDKIAILEEGQDLYFGKEEETVKEHYKIIKIDFDSIVMGYNKQEWQSQTKVLPLGK